MPIRKTKSGQWVSVPARRVRRRTTIVRRTSRRANTAGKLSTVVVRGPSVIPDRTFVKLPYMDTNYFNAAISANAIFKLNSIYDPAQSAWDNNGSPLGSDQYEALYSSYRVHGCQYSIEFNNVSANTPMNVTVLPSTSATAPADIKAAIESRYSQSKTLSVAGGMDRCKLSGFISIKKMMGLKNLSYEEGAQASSGADPSSLIYLHTFVASIDGAATTAVYATAKLKFYVEMFDPKQVVES